MKLLTIFTLISLFTLTSCSTPTSNFERQLAADLPDNEAVPVFTVEPKYPTDAVRNAISGYVEFKFDISPIGRVDELTIIGSEPEGVFDKEAEKVFKRWLFKPVIKDGVPIVQKDMKYRLVFSIE